MNRHERARLSFEGVAVGDTFGEQFFGEPMNVQKRIAARVLPSPPWSYTDDTEMAASVVEMLGSLERVDQDVLAATFARRMQSGRGYGRSTYEILCGIQQGGSWRALSTAVFGGTGSFGNGAAMRVAPLGGFFADDSLEVVAEQARLSAEITHTHPEGVAGAIAIAVAAALVWRERESPRLGRAWLGRVAAAVPKGDTRDGIHAAIALSPEATAVEAARVLGNGSGVASADTVPLCLWVVAHHGDTFATALWKTVSALGDRDTTCAIVGGVLALRVGYEGIPAMWRNARERVSGVDHERSEDQLAETMENRAFRGNG